MDVNNGIYNAVREGKLDVLKEIIKTCGISFSKAHALGHSLLRTSTKNKHTAITKFLLENGARTNNRNRRKNSNDSPLHYAAINGDIEIVNLLLDHGANINAKNEYGATALQNAVYRKELKSIEILLSRGASVNDKKNDGTTPLHTAVEGDSLQVIEILLKYGADVNIVCNLPRLNFQTPFQLATEKGKSEIVELFLNHNAIVDNPTKNNLTPVYLAALHGHENVVKQLLDHGAKVDVQDVYGQTLLYIAVQQGSLSMVEQILKKGPDLKNQMNIKALNLAVFGDKETYIAILDKLQQYGFTNVSDKRLLQVAVEKGYINYVEATLKDITNVKHFLNKLPKQSSSLLHTAAKSGQYKVAEMLIKYGANVNLMDISKKTPIFYATSQADLKTVKLLLANKASVKKCSGNLINAVRKDSKELVELLLQLNVNIKEIDDFGRSALHYTVLSRTEECRNIVFGLVDDDTTAKAEIAKILLAKGADVNARAKDGMTTLHCACLKGYKNMVELLFEYNAKMSADETGAMPIHLSAYNGNIDILKMLNNKGANINAKTKDEMTPIHFAVNNSVQDAFMEYLIKCGADIDSKDHRGSTPLHIAARNDNVHFIELILKYGADINSTDNHGRTAFSIATKEGNHRSVTTLLEYGCDVSIQGKNSLTLFEHIMMMDEDLFDAFASDNDDDDDDDDDDDEDDYFCGNDDLDYDSDYYPGYFGSDMDYNDSEEEDYFDHELNLFSGDQISEIVQHHLVMMKTANLDVNKKKEISSNSVCSPQCEFKTKCQKEFEILKREKISTNTNATFYDILSKNIDQVSIYARNPNIVEALKSNEYKKKFPIYSGMICRNFERALNRKELLDQGTIFFSLLSDVLSISLPIDCVETICKYLTDKDLRILIDAMKAEK